MVCQYINPYPPKEKPFCTYAYINSDETIRALSSSGGAFTAFASYVLSKNGVVFGASFNDKWEVGITYIEKENNLDVLRRSKYVQASVGKAYEEVKQFLAKDRMVLFVATPCQVNGLNHYLGKQYENLITVDFTCHAVPSPMVWKDYLKSLKRGISKVSFRDKSLNGWNNYSLVIESSKEKIVAEGSKQNLYMQGFLNYLYCRPSCENCISRGFSTNCDIMIGDFWNVEKYHKDLCYNDNKGVSLIMTLTQKGERFLHELGIDESLEHVDFSEAETKGSHSCIVKSCEPHVLRKTFFILYNKHYIKPLIWLCVYPLQYIRKVYHQIRNKK